MTKLPFRQQVLLVTLACIAAGYLCYSWHLKGLRQDVLQLDATVQALRDQNQSALDAKVRLAEFRSEIELQEKQLDEFRRQLPSRKETPRLMNRIHELALETNLHIKTFRPQETRQKDLYVEWPIQMTLEGNYHNLATFFEKIGKMDRLVNIEDILLVPLDGQAARNRTIGASFTALAFVYREPLP